MIISINPRGESKLDDRTAVLILLLDRLKISICEFEKERCQYCIDVMKSGYEEHFDEVLEFLGIERNILSKKETETIRTILKMYEGINIHLTSMSTYEKNQLVPYLFSGLDEVNHHAYYMFLQKYKETCVPCPTYLPKNIEEYVSYVEKYEHLSRPTTFDALILVFEQKKEAI